MPSSVVAEYKYDDETKVLRVTYVSGAIYDYKNVPADVYEAMRTFRSKGTFLNKVIKENYEFEKII